MASNYNIMANYIVSKYIERVSGKDLGETFVDDDPSKRVMVGMLSEDRVEAKFEGGYVENTNTRFDSIPSISISFIVKKNEAFFMLFQLVYCFIWFSRVMRKQFSICLNDIPKKTLNIILIFYNFVNVIQKLNSISR